MKFGERFIIYSGNRNNDLLYQNIMHKNERLSEVFADMLQNFAEIQCISEHFPFFFIFHDEQQF